MPHRARGGGPPPESSWSCSPGTEQGDGSARVWQRCNWVSPQHRDPNPLGRGTYKPQHIGATQEHDTIARCEFVHRSGPWACQGIPQVIHRVVPRPRAGSRRAHGLRDSREPGEGPCRSPYPGGSIETLDHRRIGPSHPPSPTLPMGHPRVIPRRRSRPRPARHRKGRRRSPPRILPVTKPRPERFARRGSHWHLHTPRSMAHALLQNGPRRFGAS